jgi:hypothetical protein
MLDSSCRTGTGNQTISSAASSEWLAPLRTTAHQRTPLRIDPPHTDKGPAAATPEETVALLNASLEAQLQLTAIQLASIRSHYSGRSLWQRVKNRFRNEFLRGDRKEKLRFVQSIAGSILVRTGLKAAFFRCEVDDNLPRTDQVSVAAVCNGGMGDLIIAGSFLDRFVRHYGCPPVDVVISNEKRAKEGEFVFHNSPAVRRITCRANVHPKTTPYDVVLKIGDLVSCSYANEERIRTLAPEFHRKLTSARQIQQPYRPFIEAAPLHDGLFATVAARSGLRRLDVLGWLADVPFSQDDQLCLAPDVAAYRYLIKEAGLAGKSYITIHNGFDNVALQGLETVTKAWPEEHCVEFVEQFKSRFPDVLVVQLGASTSRPIANADLCLLNATSLHDAAWILKHSLLHVDGDSGMVHLARALHTRSIVLFGPTNRDFFRYAANENLSSAGCNNCWWTTIDWVRRCPRGLAEPECMKSIEPTEVFRRAEAHLAGLTRWELRAEEVRSFDETASNQESERAGDLEIAASFRRWRDDFVIHSLRRMACAETRKRAVAVLDFAEILPPQLADMGYDTRVYNFGRDFGSLHNIPAENESYDVVVMPPLTEQSSYPVFATTEAMRVLKEGGALVLTFQFSATREGCTGVSAGSAEFFQALSDQGVDSAAICPTAGGMVLRKHNSGCRIA